MAVPRNALKSSSLPGTAATPYSPGAPVCVCGGGGGNRVGGNQTTQQRGSTGWKIYIILCRGGRMI